MRRDVGICLHFYPVCQRPLTSRLRTTEALRAGIHPRTLYALRDGGEIEQLARGLFRLKLASSAENEPDLVTVARKVPCAVFCLLTALAFQRLTTYVPHTVAIALPRTVRIPRLDRSSLHGIPLLTRLSTRWRGATPHGRRHDDPRLLSRKSLADFFQVPSQARTRTWRSKPCGSIPTGVGAIGSGCSNTRAFAGWRTSCGLILEAVM